MEDAKDSHIQHVEDMSQDKGAHPVMGTARLITDGEIVLIPRPSTDPCGEYGDLGHNEDS